MLQARQVTSRYDGDGSTRCRSKCRRAQLEKCKTKPISDPTNQVREQRQQLLPDVLQTGAVQQLLESEMGALPPARPSLNALSCQGVKLVKKRFFFKCHTLIWRGDPSAGRILSGLSVAWLSGRSITQRQRGHPPGYVNSPRPDG